MAAAGLYAERSVVNFNVRVPDGLAVRFDAWAAGQGGRSPALRHLIEAACPPAAAVVDDSPLGRRPVKLTVRLTVRDAVGLEAVASELGLTRNAWAAALMRRALQGRPTFRRSDELVLLATLSELRRIGINVNQMARALNTAVLEGRVLDVHLTVRALGDHGERLNPKRADLEAWRQVFAEQLRLRGVAAEATPRRARGVTRKAERTPVRKLRERHEAGAGPPPKVRRGAYGDAGRAAFGGDTSLRPWESELQATQIRVRRLYLRQAQVLRTSTNPADRALGDRVVGFVQSMPQPDSQRLALARELRAANRGLDRGPTGDSLERRR